MGKQNHRICAPCLFTKGGVGHEDVWGREVQQGRGRYWNSAQCISIAPEAYTKLRSSVESGALLISGVQDCVCVTLPFGKMIMC